MAQDSTRTTIPGDAKLRPGKQRSWVPPRDTGSCLPPCCAAQQEQFGHPWGNWDSHTPADLPAQNSRTREGHGTSWVPWDQPPRHPLANRHRWTSLASPPLLLLRDMKPRSRIRLDGLPSPQAAIRIQEYIRTQR